MAGGEGVPDMPGRDRAGWIGGHGVKRWRHLIPQPALDRLPLDVFITRHRPNTPSSHATRSATTSSRLVSFNISCRPPGYTFNSTASPAAR